MVRFHVWTKGQAAGLLVAAMVLAAGAASGITWLCTHRESTVAETAVPVFAAAELFLPEETLPPTPSSAMAAVPSETAPSPSPSPVADRTLRVEVVRVSPVPQASVKRVLIYHTHTYEAYAQVSDAPYAETEKWRTKDASANVVAVGRALAAALTAQGYEVVHDESAFEPPELSSAYRRSLTMLEERLKRGERYDLYIDLHRDAYVEGSGMKQTVSIGGQAVARFMVLVGKGTGQTGSGYDVKPDWEANYALAELLTGSLNRQADGLCRSISVKTGRFNQHIAPCCVLIECGNNRNTLEEVLRGVPYLAEAVMETLASADTAA